MTIHELVRGARDRLVQAGISADLAARDAEVLARQVLGWDPARFLSYRNDPASSAFLLGYEQVVARRLRREPISYILGVREFWGLDFEVTPEVLIPRPETELVIEEALSLREQLAAVAPGAGRLFYDIGTGSGILAVVLAREFPDARVIATDIAPGALQVAARNAARHGTAGRIRFVETSFFDGLDERADLIVSNPPYVPASAAPALTPEVVDYEPHVAVFSGADGLDGVRTVVAGSVERLRPGGLLIVEFGYGQDEDVARLVAAQPELRLVGIREDLQGIPRTATARRAA